MNDYFDKVEQELRLAVRRHAHLPWYVRLRGYRHFRAAAVVFGCLVVAGPALAAAGVFQTGTPLGPPVPPLPNAQEGVAIPGSVHLLSLRIPDPNGGPPWALRELKTTRGLECVQVGRLVDGKIGVLGQDGAFADDGRFHPLSESFYETSFNCGTLDARGHTFVNVVADAVPASALLNGGRAEPGCIPLSVLQRIRAEHAPPACPPGSLRGVYFGLLGPDATSVTHKTSTGALATTATGEDGAYLIVLPHAAGQYGETGGPLVTDVADYSQLATDPIRSVSYTRGHACSISAFQAVSRARHGLLGIKTATCTTVGYVAPRSQEITSADVATAISARTEAAKSFCVDNSTQNIEPCGAVVPAGYQRVRANVAKRNDLLVVTWTSRVAVTNQDSHYEVYNSNTGAGHTGCADGGTNFGPTQTNISVGQQVVFTSWVAKGCPGISQGSVAFVQDNGPAGSIPVPAQPGEGPDIPVGKFSVVVP